MEPRATRAPPFGRRCARRAKFAREPWPARARTRSATSREAVRVARRIGCRGSGGNAVEVDSGLFCLRAGWLAWRAGFALPELLVSRAGEGFVRVDWLRDPSGFDAMPVQFLEEGSAVAPRDVVIEELSKIVDGVLARCQGIESPELSALRERWALRADATSGERRLLERAGRLGLDAYDAGDRKSTRLNSSH